MIKISDTIFRLDKPDGIFLIFGNYDSESSFNEFLEFIGQNLGAEIGSLEHHSYSSSATISFAFGNAIAACDDEIGCVIRVNENIIAETIITKSLMPKESMHEPCNIHKKYINDR